MFSSPKNHMFMFLHEENHLNLMNNLFAIDVDQVYDITTA